MEVKMINNRPVKIWTNNVEESAMRQIENLTTLPFLFHHLGIIHAIRNQDDMQEASGAYKDIETVIANEADLVKVKTRLLPVAVIKG